MTTIKKAVLPVAGLGTRFLPATKAIPKEMLPLGDKPVIQYLVEEAVAAGIEEIIFVVSEGKEAIQDHFSENPHLESLLESKGKQDLLEKVRKPQSLAKFSYVNQDDPLGDGHAILQAKELLGDEPFFVLFGDDLIDGPKGGAQQLIESFEEKQASIIALEKIPPEKSESYGMIKPKSSEGHLHEVESLVEKPAPENAPSDLGIIGKYVCTPEIWKHLEAAESSHGGEIRLIDGFRSLISEQPIYGLEMEGTRYDTGTPEGLAKAVEGFTKK